MIQATQHRLVQRTALAEGYPRITMTEGSGLTRAFEKWADEQDMPAQRSVACNSMMGIVGLTIADVGSSNICCGS